MKVYGHLLSTCTRKVLLTFAEKGESVELVPVDLFAGEHKAQAHLARHPFGVVPVLDDDGFVLFESRAILRYLDARLGGAPLTPPGAREAARMSQWLSVDQAYVAPYVRTLAVQRILRRHEGLAPEPGAAEAAEAVLTRAFTVIDRALASTCYLAGEAFSLADVSLMPYVASLAMLDAGHLLADVPRLGGWWERVRSRDAWGAVTART
jgi:glutathione S-transferase